MVIDAGRVSLPLCRLIGFAKNFGGPIREGYFPVLHRNSTIPISRKGVYSTVDR